MNKRKQSSPVSVLDVAAYILANHTHNTPIQAWKMHKLVYYCQVWLLVRDGQPFFYEKIMASPKGIIITELLALHYSHLYVGDSSKGNMNHLSLRQIDLIDYVMKKYGHMTLDELDELTKREAPWNEARQAHPREKGSLEISHELLLKYYKED